MENTYLSNEELMDFHQVFLTSNIKYIKKYLSQYSSEQIINSLIRIIRGNSASDLNMYESLFLADNLDINQPSSLGGDTLLYSATVVNTLWMVKDLVARGADVNALCINGSYPLLSASLNQHRLEILEFLLEKGADPNIITNLGDTC